MVLGLYYTLTEAELLAMREQVLLALEAARKGERFQSTSGHGRGYVKDNLTYDQLRNELVEVNAALRNVNPDSYGGKRVFTSYPDFSSPTP